MVTALLVILMAASPAWGRMPEGFYVRSVDGSLHDVSAATNTLLDGKPVLDGVPYVNDPVNTVDEELKVDGGSAPICSRQRKTLRKFLSCVEQERQNYSARYLDTQSSLEAGLASFNKANGGAITLKELAAIVRANGDFIAAGPALLAKLQSLCSDGENGKCAKSAVTLRNLVIATLGHFAMVKRLGQLEDSLRDKNKVPKDVVVLAYPKVGREAAKAGYAEPDISPFGIGGMTTYTCPEGFPVGYSCPGSDFDPLAAKYLNGADAATMDAKQEQKIVTSVYKDTLKPWLKSEVDSFLIERYLQTFVAADFAEHPDGSGFKDMLTRLRTEAGFCRIHSPYKKFDVADEFDAAYRKYKGINDASRSEMTVKFKEQDALYQRSLGIAALKYAQNKKTITRINPRRFENDGECGFIRQSALVQSGLSDDERQKEAALKSKCNLEDWPQLKAAENDNFALTDSFPVLGETLSKIGPADRYLADAKDPTDLEKRARTVTTAFAAKQKKAVLEGLDKLCRNPSDEAEKAVMNPVLMHDFFACEPADSEKCRTRLGLARTACSLYKEHEQDEALVTMSKQMVGGTLLGIFPYSFPLVEGFSLGLDYADRKSKYDDTRRGLLAGLGGARELKAAEEHLDDFTADAFRQLAVDGLMALAAHGIFHEPGKGSIPKLDDDVPPGPFGKTAVAEKLPLVEKVPAAEVAPAARVPVAVPFEGPALNVKPPRPIRLRAALKRLKNRVKGKGVVEAVETADAEQALLQSVVADDQKFLDRNIREGGKLKPNESAMEPGCVEGMCGLGRDDIHMRIESFAKANDIPIEIVEKGAKPKCANCIRVYRHQARETFGANKHAFTVVEFPSGNKYLVDTTYRQFFNPENTDLFFSGASGKYIREESGLYTKSADGRYTPTAKGERTNFDTFLEDGFIPLDDTVADQYGRSMVAGDKPITDDVHFTTGDFLKSTDVVDSDKVELRTWDKAAKRYIKLKQ